MTMYVRMAEGEVPSMYSMEKEEDTQAQKAQRRLRLYRVLAAGLVLLLIFTLVWGYAKMSNGSRKALREAKDVRMALKMLAIELYSVGGTVYDPTTRDGLMKGGAQRLQQLSEADGEVILTGWDSVESDALSFTYTTGNYVVVFRRDAAVLENLPGEEDVNGDGMGDEWEVYLQLRVTDLS